MNLYRVSPSLSFLETLADFILENFANKDSISKLKVILPSGTACLALQNILVHKQKIAILPTIIPLANIMVEGEEIFKINSKNLEPITFLEEKIILTKIIYNYPKLKFTIKQTLQICGSIAELFSELAEHNLSITDIGEREEKNSFQNWNFIYEFLKYIEQERTNQLKSLQKQDRINHQIIMMEAELSQLKYHNCRLIVAGIIGINPLIWKFLKEVASLPGGFIILPPIDGIAVSCLAPQELLEEDCLYNLKQLLFFLGKNLSDFLPLGNCAGYNIILNKLIIKNSKYKNIEECPFNLSHIKYFEWDDLFQEAEQIALICQKYSDKKIAIIIENPIIKPFYCTFLTKYLIEFQDLLGNNLSQSLISSLIISISEILCNDFDIQKLLILLKNPLINFKLVQELESLIINKHCFILSSTQLLSLIESSDNDGLIEWGRKLIKLFYQNIDNSFINILKASIKIAETLYPDIWYEQSSYELSNFLSELIKIANNLILENKEFFSTILKTLMTGCKYFESNSHSKNIVISKVEDIVLLKFDLVILADFNHQKWDYHSSTNKWVREKTLQELQVNSSKIKSSIYQYFFYLLLHNNQVIITRAKRQNDKVALLPSKLLLKLEFILGNKLIRQNDLIRNNDIKHIKQNECQLINKKAYIHSPTFPDILTVTNVEMLIRNPYSFYAKMILVLRHKEIIGQDLKASEFGIFIHRILEQYCKNYNKLIKDKVKSILAISDNILQNTIVSLYTKKIWQVKFIPIARSFIEFDEERRKYCRDIYSECKGKINLFIAGKELKIVAVADRIEVDHQGRAVIIDYKTGTLPSKKDIELGLSPQLIIEALILQKGGFEVKTHNIKQVVYVKFSSSQPYIQILEIDLSKEVLNSHQQGMLHLLEYYIVNKNFFYEIDLLSYNDYTHLARMLRSLSN